MISTDPSVHAVYSQYIQHERRVFALSQFTSSVSSSRSRARARE